MTAADLSRRPARLLAAMIGVVVSGVALLGCGQAAVKVAAAPAAVDPKLAPTTVQGNLGLFEYQPARKTFANASKESLVADGRVWEIRQGQVLVGTLQISTVTPGVNVETKKDRKAIIDGVMTGSSYDAIDVDGVSVATAAAGDKTLYVWFGRGLFEVLQLKSAKLNAEGVLHDLISYQRTNAGLPVGGPGGATDPSS